MTNAWDLILYTVGLVVDGMKDVQLFYGVSVWELCMTFFVLDIIYEIIAHIFKHDGSGEKE